MSLICYNIYMTNQLKHLDLLTKLIDNYKVPPAAAEHLDSLKLALLVATTSSGRNTLINKMTQRGDYRFLISDTTRSPRVNDGVAEKNGVNYWFISESEAIDKLKSDQYMEVSLVHDQQVSGVTLDELAKATSSNKIAIKDIDYQGADKIYALKPDTKLFFILPPSMSEWMKRIKGRGHMDSTEMRRRLMSARKELRHVIQAKHYLFVINQDIDSTIDKINSMLHGSAAAEMEQQAGLALAQQLYQELDQLV